MIRGTMAGAALAACIATVAHGQAIGLYGNAYQIDVSVQANTPAFTVTSGQTYAVFIVGAYAYTGGSEIAYPTVWLPPDGNGQIPHGGPAPQFPFGSICAQIGNGPVFLIGERRTFVADQSGALRFWVNDNFTGDNVGQMTAFVYSNGPIL